MPVARKRPALKRASKAVAVPPAFKELFGQQPRLIRRPHLPGIWPIPVDVWRNPDLMKKLAADKDFIKDYSIAVTARR